MKPGRIVMLVLGTLSALLGLGLLAGAGFTGWANYQQRDGGFFTTPSERYSSDSYALTSPRLDIMTEARPGIDPGVVPGSVMLRGSTADSAKQIFIGIAPQADVARYLTDVRHSELTEVRFSPFRAEYREVSGTQPPARPADQTFWTASATGAGSQELKWDLRPGNWAVVIMNADASSPVSVDLRGGARSDLLWPVFLGLLIGGIVLLALGVPLIVAGAAGLGRGHPPQGPGPGPQPGVAYAASAGEPYGGVQPPAGGYGAAPYAAPPPGSPRPGGYVYPARLSGYLDPHLSRWLWLVKWFLAIPHYIVLFFLWFAFVITTIVAGFAILFTGRYPRSLFNFNVGVIRWSWRVAFYSYSAIGTDQYPPFTLARTGYPADFDVDYPEKLSHGLVLVKSWLLAIPHLLIVGVLTGTMRGWGGREGYWADGQWIQQNTGISLIGLLVLIAGVILLFTGQYWRGLFDLLMGLNRWIYRVLTYVALMRDEYPPFHLDMGPTDPGDLQPLAPAGPPAAPAYGQTASAYGETAPAAGPPQPGQSSQPPGFYGIGGPPASVPPEVREGRGPESPQPGPESGPEAPRRP
ncbi:DUF4389 domain-containing protein [Arthrobacter sp. UKPF54-2]|uniref:DUF4389 domain-containing protein n=1 Tax=Arthrobacter sp. UKPF54-2 TaxID=2600159 RepID=UPI0011B155A8|nr:DUF4389 domain-containing protein [Arthrobacter sp. UKPF54-2]QDY89847.1 DUF4389 domain-containing protein [Arthrobacter sp. UKPF54-2]